MKPTPDAWFIPFILLTTIIISSLHLTFCSADHGIIMCPEPEKQAVLRFKQLADDPSIWPISSWKSEVDCCRWGGVTCNNITGHVVELHLSESGLTGALDNSMFMNLSQLTHLDLSFNVFQDGPPSAANFLPKLQYFDISGNSLKIPDWLYECKFLEYLDASGIYLQGGSFTISNSIANLTSLKYLDLNGYTLLGSPISNYSIANLASLNYLDLSGNSFQGSSLSFLANLTSLSHLHLFSNSLQGSISNSFENLTSLKFLDLSYNDLSGEIPSDIASLCLQDLRITSNNLGGDISNAFGNMSNCFLQSLENLDFSGNQLYGNLTNYQFVEFKRLNSINLKRNRFSGPLPSNLGKLVSLEEIRLSDNKFTGNLPKSMGQLFNLSFFEISNNMLEGIVTETHFANLTSLEYFIASGNHLTLKVGDNWIPNFQLSYLELGSWNLGAGGLIPKWLHTAPTVNLSSLDLSNTGIAGPIPSWFWDVTENLNLSHNKLSGSFDDHAISALYLIDLGSNLFHGSLPRINAESMNELDLSNNSFSGRVEDFLCGNNSTIAYSGLWNLNLEGNLLSGELPDCFMNFGLLSTLSLANNNFSGRIPESIGNLGQLESLNLFNNKLSGGVPSSMQNCTKLWKIDLSDNQLIGKIPNWMGTCLPALNILILRSNKLGGKISSGICHLTNLRILDLSNNNFSGTVPSCIDNFTAMASPEWSARIHYYLNQDSATVAIKGTRLHYDTILSLVTNIDLSNNKFSGDIPKQFTRLAQLRSLNLSRNHLNGKIPDGIEDMKVLESLDLSNNFLSGKIPHGFAGLSSLSYLNVSYNNLSGEIPQSTQILTLNASSFLGNKLCGPPLTSGCKDAKSPAVSVPGGHEQDGAEWLYVFISLGYGMGLAMVFNVLFFKKLWRYIFIEAVDNMWNKLFG